jgi:hypothetical protein
MDLAVAYITEMLQKIRPLPTISRIGLSLNVSNYLIIAISMFSAVGI